MEHLHIADAFPTPDLHVHQFYAYAPSVKDALHKAYTLRVYAAPRSAHYIGTYIEACPSVHPLMTVAATHQVRIVSLYRW